MQLLGIHHVSILVSDMERAVAFYRDRLGLAEVVRPSNFVTPVRWFELGAQQLHLIPSPVPDSISPRHFAIQVEDCPAAREHLERVGVQVRETVPIADPDGNQIEIIQWFRSWDGESEAELGVPDNAGRRMMSEDWERIGRLHELPTALPGASG